ncbi:MAG TPA: DUF4156 domain-containing protein [Polyangiaceae bacterium]|nr:DUF4156 domain-containing protein [Polyangiaceae bacterium]
MTHHPFFGLLASATLLSLAACNGVAAVPALSPQAQQVRVEDREPPEGATALGAISVTHGQGCSFSGDHGTREGATAMLKDAAAQRGANFVQVTKVVEPYSGHDCTHREFKMEGLSYRLAGTPIVVASSPPPLPVPAPALDCSPPCSPGYACEAGVCQALCNPACGAGQVCRADRVCVPAAAAPERPPTP